MDNQEMIYIDDNEMADFITSELAKENIELSKEQIFKVLDLEFEFLKLKGVVE